MKRNVISLVFWGALLSACGTTMRPIAEDGNELIYQHMRPEFSRAQASAIQHCSASGLIAKHEISTCWVIGDRPDVGRCFDTPLCERCRSTFYCVEKPLAGE